MTITLQWFDDGKSIICAEYRGNWKLSEFYDTHNQINAMIDNSTHLQIGVILDMRQSRSLPPGFMSSMRSIHNRSHPRQGAIVLVGANTFVKNFVDIVRRLYPGRQQRFMMASTLEEAQTLLKNSSS